MTAADPSAAVRVLSGLLEARTGQQLAPSRHWRLDTMLAPVMRARGLKDLDALVQTLLASTDRAFEDEIVDGLLNNETSFFRDPVAFQLIQELLIDVLRARAPAARKLRLWSAGCSTGQEVYSLAMIGQELAAALPGARLDIIGTDASSAAIDRARRGLYTPLEINRGLPIRRALSHFTQTADGWQIDASLAATVRFRREAVTEGAPGGPFDLILCRNLLFYLPVVTRRAVFDRLAGALAPDGVLILGAGETVIGQTDRFAADPDNRGFYRLDTPPPLRRTG